jgi:hypothetical protein
VASTSARRAENRHPAKPRYLPHRPGPLGDDEFRTFLLRPKPHSLGTKTDISDETLSVSWQDSGAILTGELQEQDPDPTMRKRVVNLGDTVLLMGRAKGFGSWSEVWRMRVKSASLSLKPGTRAWELTDDLQNLADSKDSFKFSRKKPHQRGFLASEIAITVCKRYGIPIGKITRTKYRIKNQTMKDGSPMDVITDAYKTERTQTGRRYVIRFRRGRLWITPLFRSSLLYEMSETIADGSFNLTKREDYATVLTVNGTPTVHKGKDAKGHTKRKTKKVTARVTRQAFTARYGVIHQSVAMKGIDSLSEARKRGLASLSRRMTPKREMTFTHPGVLGIRRGQALRLRDPEKGSMMVCWIQEVRHNVSAGDYSMEVTVTFSDPFKPTQADKRAAARFKRAQAKGRKAAAARKKKRVAASRRARARAAA